MAAAVGHDVNNGAGDVLVLFGALDSALHESGSSQFGSAVDRYLPGYAAHAGWYQELLTFMFGDADLAELDVAWALTSIAEADKVGKRLRQPIKARLLYFLSTLARVQSEADSGLPQLADPAIREMAVNALAAAGKSSLDCGSRTEQADVLLDEFLRCNPKNSSAFARQRDFIGEETAATPLCKTSLVTVDGKPSIRIDTATKSERVSLNGLKEVVNPYNWNSNYPEFFLSMEEPAEPTRVIREDQWRRVLEKVQLVPGFELTTPLKYFASDNDTTGASLDYDLDISQLASGDGRVQVDKGYINMSVDNDSGHPDQPGVLARTCKIVRIDGISPFAQERLVCITGYSTASSDFLFGQADYPEDGPRPFIFPVDEIRPDALEGVDPPAAPARHAVPAAAQHWIDTLQGVAVDSSDLAEKWWDGTLTMSQLSEYCSRVGGKLAGAPADYLDSIIRSRYRAR